MWFSCVLCFRVLTSLHSRCQVGLHCHLRLHHLLGSRGCWQNLFLCSCTTHGGLLLQSRGESLKSGRLSPSHLIKSGSHRIISFLINSFGTLITFEKSFHLCYILLARSKSQVLSALEEIRQTCVSLGSPQGLSASSAQNQFFFLAQLLFVSLKKCFYCLVYLWVTINYHSFLKPYPPMKQSLLSTPI